ncbi:MAG: hypothetical protein WBL80_01620 [Erysipelotrichaceae bacterium]
MSYPEKRTIVSIITGVLILGAYILYAFGKYQAGLTTAGDLKFWAGTMLVFIGIGIVANIIIQIVFHILLSISIAVVEKVKDINFDEKLIEKSLENEMVSDEMDKLIELKSMRVSFIVAGVGFMLALVSMILNDSAVLMINILFVSFSVGSLIEGVSTLYFYRHGV